jgi:hypothetical protein
LRHLLVILFETPPNFASLNPHHGVLSRGVSWRALEHLYSDCAFLEPLGLSVEFAQNHVTKKLLAPARALEVTAG